jgi:hypothetical protein
MKKHLLLLSMIALVIAFVGMVTLFTTNVRADEWDKKTVLTFNEPVQVPGTVLPAGTYMFKLADTEGDRNIVQIFNADGTHLITTVMAIADYRTTVPGKTIVTFAERASGQPEAVQTWFYSGDNYGQEFVYPKQKATELAQVNQRPVPSVPDEISEPTELKTAAVTRVEPEPPAPAVTNAPEPEPSTTVAAVEELPQTASPIASIALLGLLCLAAAGTVRRLGATTK